MIDKPFSRTALAAAGYRAAHQTVENGALVKDTLALALLGADAEALLLHCADPAMRPLRIFVALRSRIAEAAARQAILQGARQVVVLGAGLDSFVYRLEPQPGLRTFEVDHPSTQTEKRRRLAAAGVAIPDHARFAACDFERQTLADALEAAGFDFRSRAAGLWLGVTPYLTRDAVEATLRVLASVRGGVDVVLDYANPVDSIESAGHRLFHERMAARVAELGEAFRSHFATEDLHAVLAGLGFAIALDWGPREIAAQLGAPPPPNANGGHILHATKRAVA